jgi:hypothetical protein
MRWNGAIRPSKAAHMKGVAFSLEAMLSALVLFAIMLFGATMSRELSKPFTNFSQLRETSIGMAQMGANSGAWLLALPPTNDDSHARTLLSALPPSICARVEIFNGTTDPGNLLWAYAGANCTRAIGQERAIALWPMAKRDNASSSDFMIARVTAWPQSG